MLTIRLRRQGARNNPFYRVVLNDSRRTPRATALEELGYYDPTRNPKVLSLKEDRIAHWVSQGAILSETVAKLRKKGVSSEPIPAKNTAPAPVAEPVAEEAVAEEAQAEEAQAEEAAAEEAPAEEATEASEPEATEEAGDAEEAAEEPAAEEE